jgi:hypothetical protein
MIPLRLVCTIILASVLVLSSCSGNGEEEPILEWQTHVYKNEEMGFALSFATPPDWVATGPIGERRVGGWYDPSYPKPPDPNAIWCYWITCTPPVFETVPSGDPIEITSEQERIATVQMQGDWSYHLMCVAPVNLFEEEEPIFNKIMESLTPLPE